MAIRNDLWSEVKRLRYAGKFAILKCDNFFLNVSISTNNHSPSHYFMRFLNRIYPSYG